MSNKPKILGLSGKIGSGKTFVAEFLCKEFGFMPVSFAEQLKADVVCMGFSPHDVYKEKPAPIRALLQAYGQAKRMDDPLYWVKRGMASAHRLHGLYPDGIVVFDDVRFPNEKTAIQDAGGMVIRLINVSTPMRDNEDASETALDNAWFDAGYGAAQGDTKYLTDCVVEKLVTKGWL